MTNRVQDAVSTSVRLHQALRRESRKDIAAVLGVTPAAVSHRLSGLTKWSLDDLDALARHWDVSPAQLLEPPVSAFASASGRVTHRYQSAMALVVDLPSRPVRRLGIAA